MYRSLWLLGAFVALIAVAIGLGGGLASADTSGANASGYVWIDNNSPDPVTTYAWVDATGGTAIASTNCDDCADTVALPFTFTYFGTDYTEVDIGTNGLLGLNTADPNSCNENYNWNDLPIPQDDTDCSSNGWGANPLIAPWFDDLDPGECGDVYYNTFGSAPDRTFVVEFSDVCHNDCFDCAPGEGITFEAILSEGSNDLKFQYQDAFFGTGSGDISEENNGGTATVGLDKDATTGLQYSNNATVITDGLAILFTTQAPEPTPTATQPAPTETPGPEGGLSLSVGDTSVSAGEDVDVTATVVDGAGNPVAGVDCTFSIASQPGSDAAVDAGPVATDATGEATTTLHAGSTPGTVQVQADCGAFTEILDVVVSPALPSTGAGDRSTGLPLWMWALAAGLAALGLGALRFRARRV